MLMGRVRYILITIDIVYVYLHFLLYRTFYKDKVLKFRIEHFLKKIIFIENRVINELNRKHFIYKNKSIHIITNICKKMTRHIEQILIKICQY